eukprot:363873-Chlamydomonas_euryale.AAC.5
MGACQALHPAVGFEMPVGQCVVVGMESAMCCLRVRNACGQHGALTVANGAKRGADREHRKPHDAVDHMLHGCSPVLCWIDKALAHALKLVCVVRAKGLRACPRAAFCQSLVPVPRRGLTLAC